MRTETSTAYAIQNLYPPKSESQGLAASVLLRVAFSYSLLGTGPLLYDFTAKAAAQDSRLSISPDQRVHRGPSSPKILCGRGSIPQRGQLPGEQRSRGISG